MADGEFLTIGELARAAGLTAKTVRFWSDQGLLPPAGRTPAGYRLYGPGALARLGLIRALRDLGVGLAGVRKVLDREITIGEVAAVHAAALEVQVRALRLQQAVLRAVASRGITTAEEFQLMHKLANLSAAERRRMVTDFIDDTFAGIDVSPGFLTMMRTALPDLPGEPTREQIEAWVELAELVQDPGFRASLRQTATAFARSRADVAAEPGAEASQAMAVYLRERAGAATEAGIEPGPRRPDPSLMTSWPLTPGTSAGRTGWSSGPGCWSSWNQAATGGTSGTGSCSRSSTAGPLSQRSCPRPNG